eukprot:m.9747 g.9747  ORF g.9747 m.9747 type:complete len:501 (-) comp4126_c0_seq1:70-1572(-)
MSLTMFLFFLLLHLPNPVENSDILSVVKGNNANDGLVVSFGSSDDDDDDEEFPLEDADFSNFIEERKVRRSHKSSSEKSSSQKSSSKKKSKKYKKSKLTFLRLRYIGFNYGGTTIKSACHNMQGYLGHKWGFQPLASYPSPQNVLIGVNNEFLVSLGADNTIEIGASMYTSKKKKKQKKTKLGSETTITLYDKNTGLELGSVYIHTSCSYPIAVRDRFGFMEVDALLTNNGEISGCANKIDQGFRDTTSPPCIDIDDDFEGRVPLPQPESTTPTVSTVGGSCVLRLYGGLSPGVCPGTFSQDVEADVSVGFGTQICTSFTTNVSGSNTFLHITVQPQCGGSGSEIYRVCSFEPDFSDARCNAIPPTGRLCCAPVEGFISPPLPTSPSLSCQDYEIGTCQPFFGFNGVDPQEYHLSLESCSQPFPSVACALHAQQTVKTTGDGQDIVVLGSMLGAIFLLLGVAVKLYRERIQEPTLSDYSVPSTEEYAEARPLVQANIENE